MTFTIEELKEIAWWATVAQFEGAAECTDLMQRVFTASNVDTGGGSL